MNRADIAMHTYAHHSHVAHGAIPASNFELSSSFFANPAFTYPTQYNTIDLGYDLGLGYSGCNLGHGANASPQQIFGQHGASYSEQGLHVPATQQPAPGEPAHRSPAIKVEAASQDTDNIEFHPYSVPTSSLPTSTTDRDVGTDVDTLMRAIQTKAKTSSTQAPSSVAFGGSSESSSSETNSSATRKIDQRRSKARRKYPCKVQSCTKVFTQKTHLEIHMRAHTGYKPYVGASVFDNGIGPADEGYEQLCRETSCGQRFSQLGNLKVSTNCNTEFVTR